MAARCEPGKMRSYQVDRWQMARWAAVLTVAGMVVCLVLYPSQKKSEAQLHEQGLWRSPKLAVDAYVVRRVGGGEFQVLLIQVSCGAWYRRDPEGGLEQPSVGEGVLGCKHSEDHRANHANRAAGAQRSREPHKGSWALPGGFVAWMEDPPAAVAREVAEETQLVVDQQVRVTSLAEGCRKS